MLKSNLFKLLGIGCVCLTYAACKIPVVATNVGGIPELITNGVTGVLVPSENTEKLLEEINNLLKDKEYAKKLADAAHDFVIKNMTWEVWLPKYVKFYEELVE